MELSINIKYDIKWPRELLEKRTQYMIDTTGREVVRGIKHNIVNARSVYGGQLRRLKPATIRRKKGMRYPSRALHALGILYRAIHYYRGHRPNRGTVGIAMRGKPPRREVALWQQTGTYKGGIARRFFGISRELREGRLIPMWNTWFHTIWSRTNIFQKGKI